MSILDRSGMARTLADWIDVESVTGGEEDFARAAASALESRGFAVELQRVDEGRYNVLARADAPSVVFCDEPTTGHGCHANARCHAGRRAQWLGGAGR